MPAVNTLPGAESKMHALNLMSQPPFKGGFENKIAPHHKNHTLFEIKMAKIDTLGLTEISKKPYPLEPHVPRYPSPQGNNILYLQTILVKLHPAAQTTWEYGMQVSNMFTSYE